MHKNQKGGLLIIVMVAIVLVAGVGFAAWRMLKGNDSSVTTLTGNLEATPAPMVKNGYVRLVLTDRQSHKKITKTHLTVYTDNGTRCIKAPCQTDYSEWEGETTKDGYIEVPDSQIKSNTTIMPDGYDSETLDYVSGTNLYSVEFSARS